MLVGLKEQYYVALKRHLPTDVGITVPATGSSLWLELPRGIQARTLFTNALDAGIAIAPGDIFAVEGLEHAVRLSFARPYDERITWALATLGQLIAKL